MNADLSKIRMFIMDVDGTLTDGKIYISNNGEAMKAFNPKDGLGIKLLLKHNIIPVIITGRTSDIVRRRCEEIGIQILFQGITKKAQKVKELMDTYHLQPEEVCYIGDDLNDLGAMKVAGISFAPSDCANQIRPHIDILLTKRAGEGPVREAIDMILENRITAEDIEEL